MIVLQVRDLVKANGDALILDHVSLTLREREKIGLIGTNGSGKTTLLRCVTGDLELDAGDVSVQKGLRLGYLRQLTGQDQESTVWEAAMHGFQRLTELREQIKTLEQAISGCGQEVPEQLARRYDAVFSSYERDGGYACENLAKRILSGLGFAEGDFSLPVRTLSGGQTTRLYLTALLASQPDILILDEPTNHLDIAAVEWLEHYLRDYKGAVLLVSHDRRFLNRAVTRIIELSEGVCRSYAGGYDQFLIRKEQETLALERAAQKQEAYIARTEAFIARYRAGIKSRQAAGREKQLRRLERLSRPAALRVMHPPQLQMDGAGGKKVLDVAISRCGYAARLFEDTGLTLRQGERVGLIGPNGAGKSTLLKILLDQTDQVDFQGEILWGSRIVLGYFSQNFEQLHPSWTLLEELQRDCGVTMGEGRNLLGSILFSQDRAQQWVSTLSGGEKARLALLKMILSGANCLLLDEPTNHLDIESRLVIETMLAEYAGTMLVVSHDRYFLERLVNRIVAVEAGRLVSYPGGYEAYLQRRGLAVSAPERPAPPRAEDLRAQEKDRQRRLKQLQKKIADNEALLRQLNQERRALEEKLEAAGAEWDSSREAEALHRRYISLGAALERAEETWLCLQEELEASGA
jgi:ATP-binding cassette subfamily F protein 3